MTATEDQTALHVPARVIPVPTSVSKEAQAFLAMGPMQSPEDPTLDDLDGWRNMIATVDDMMLGIFRDSGMLSPEGFEIDDIEVGGVRVFVITPPGLDPDDTRVFLEPHGGAFIVGKGELCLATGIMTARKLGMRVWSIDYRMPPDHPYPAALDDCLAVYRALLTEHRSEELVVGGTSAGGNLSAALIVRARDEGLPMPAAAILLTPGMDLTHSGDTFCTNMGVDTIITRSEGRAMQLYAGGHDVRDPSLSPLFSDFSKGFPPTLLASGTRDVLLSDTVRTHRALRAANITADLHVLEAAPHGFFRGAPEDAELDREVRRFIDEHCPIQRH